MTGLDDYFRQVMSSWQQDGATRGDTQLGVSKSASALYSVLILEQAKLFQILKVLLTP